MPIPLQADHDAGRFRVGAQESRDAGQTRRLSALGVIDDGATRSDAASVGGVRVQIVPDWVVKLNTGGPPRRPRTVLPSLSTAWCPGKIIDFIEKIWSGRRDSNPRPQPWQGAPGAYARVSGLPLSQVFIR